MSAVTPALGKATDLAIKGTTEKMTHSTITLEESIIENEKKIADLEQKNKSYLEAISDGEREIKRLKLENKRDNKRLSIVREARAKLESVNNDVIDQ